MRHVDRRYVAVLVVLAVLTAAVVLAQAEVLAGVLAGGWSAWWVVAVVTARAGVVWGGRVVTRRFAVSMKAALRKRVLRDGRRGTSGAVTTLVVKGVDSVEPYFAGYLPQAVVAAVVPVAVVARLSFADLTSAVVVLLTLPLVPVFAALVGSHTRDRTRAQWAGLAVVGGHFLDVVRGMGTLKVFGRAAAQAGTVRAMAAAHAAATMRTLRVAFLSALVLELVATLSVALVAVPVGLRLLHGGVTLPVALLVLLLAPEAYLPLRAAGSQFHAAAEGLAVLEAVPQAAPGTAPGARSRAASRPAPQVVAAQGSSPGGSPILILPEGDDAEASSGGGCGQLVEVGRTRAPDLRTAGIVVDQVVVRYPGREALGGMSLRVAAGERVGLVGPSGVGKSTLLAVVLGFVTPASGRVLVGGVDLREIDRESWLRQVAWVPQRPTLFPGTVGENIALGSSGDVRGAAAEMGLAGLVDAEHPLSSGERQRVALARALVRDEARLLLLDEPTSRLDGGTEDAVVRATRRLVAGRTAIVVAHRPAVLDEVDRVVAFG
ncbi:thiol reductant ABC exporter subunit CydD [Saccharothrix texasensis]|uniref:ATP-binding cassette subfamily C protein/ATP-binding cassette subfamily C protein CydD n=1 Tax=Saccharothrix texasensis TaxID=103734 RepID=A0A3N1H7F1_9PSEU|nr:thiol reductant ABC exporter subunit CydD [Saccharothrix texasensis]ROP38418.1 ATP-binding cassette subfamily C protein/ATP-binding cassette subfamily C protein CydD [Saccharothrix texasensis]